MEWRRRTTGAVIICFLRDFLKEKVICLFGRTINGNDYYIDFAHEIFVQFAEQMTIDKDTILLLLLSPIVYYLLLVHPQKGSSVL